MPSIQNEKETSQQDINSKERLLQTKRQEYSSLRESENALRDEAGSVRIETSMAVAMVENKRAEYKRINVGLREKQGRLGILAQQLEDIGNKLTTERLGTISTEQMMETIVKSLASREKDLQQAEKNIAGLKKTLYKDSNRLADLRKHETDLMAEIRGILANIKNYASKSNELEIRYTVQHELLSNANF